MFRTSHLANVLMILVFHLGADCAWCCGEPVSVEAETVRILADEARSGKINVGVLNIACEAAEAGVAGGRLQACGEESKERFTSALIDEVARRGKRSTISIIDRDRMDWILKEKKLQVTGLTEKTASSIGGIAGLDAILLGRMRYGKPETLVLTAIRVSDAKILGVAEPRTSGTLVLDEMTSVNGHSARSIPLMLKQGGVVCVQIEVLSGNPVHIALFTSAEFEKYKDHKMRKHHAAFESDKTARYRQSLYLAEGEYVLVLKDKSLGGSSETVSSIRVKAAIESD